MYKAHTHTWQTVMLGGVHSDLAAVQIEVSVVWFCQMMDRSALDIRASSNCPRVKYCLFFNHYPFNSSQSGLTGIWHLPIFWHLIAVKSLVVLLVILNDRDICPSNCFGYSYLYMKCFLSPQKSWFWHASLLCLNYVLLKVHTAACSLGEDLVWNFIKSCSVRLLDQQRN